MLAYLSKATRASTALPLFPLTLSLGGVYDRVNFSSIAGTVKEYDHHILVRIPQSGSGWPSLIERHPKVLSIFKSLAILKGRLKESTVKVTAYEPVHSRPCIPPAGDATLDMIVYPIGVRYTSLPEELLESALTRCMNETEISSDLSPNLPQVEQYEEDVSRKLHLFVCCHGSRDRRCGERGAPLAARLHELVEEKGLTDKIEVFQSSHVGGHKYAGNLLIYGSSHPADGDWFGCLSAKDAAQVLDGLVGMEVGSDGGVEGVLRPVWRGRMGLSRTEQIHLWEAGGEVVEFVESDAEDEADS